MSEASRASRSALLALEPLDIGLAVLGHFEKRLGGSRVVDIFREAAALFNAGAHVRNDILSHAARTQLAKRRSVRRWISGACCASATGALRAAQARCADHDTARY
jgi:hypothetical protein